LRQKLVKLALYPGTKKEELLESIHAYPGTELVKVAPACSGTKTEELLEAICGYPEAKKEKAPETTNAKSGQAPAANGRVSWGQEGRDP
jgi:hypothetical protein